MITANDFARIRVALGELAEEDIEWAQGCCPPENAYDFAREVIFVICNSGMKNTVARGIYEKCIVQLDHGRPVIDVFRHAGKVAAIEYIWRERLRLYTRLICDIAAADGTAETAEHILTFAESLPWIGGITKYHVAKNFGAQLAKPDVHLQRLADREGTTAQALCERLAGETGLCVAAVDTVLWRACANGVLDSRTGELRA